MKTLYVQDGEGFREADSEDVIRKARAIVLRRFRIGAPALTTPCKMREYLQLHIGPLDYEVFGVVYLDARRRLIKVEDLFRGTVDCAQVYVREVVHGTLRNGASAVVAFHNHPSGGIDPSPADDATTQRLKAALALIDVQLLDHLIVGARVFSFAENGLL